MSVISLRNLSYVTPDGHLLLDHIDLTFGRERIAIVGPNGIGKSTLLKLASGDLQPTAGSVERRGAIRVLDQIIQADPSRTVADALGVGDALVRLARLQAGLASPEDVSEADWTLEARVEDVLRRFGMAGVAIDRPLASLSGGQQARVALAALVFDEPDMILLDEPTNNLDRKGRELVRRVLENWRGGAIVISHDRELLQRMDRIIEISDLGARFYGGNWDVYATQKKEEQVAAERRLASAEQQAKRIQRKVQVARERKARRDAHGRHGRPKGSQPKMLLDARKQRAENTAGQESRLAHRQQDQAKQELDEARSKVGRTKRLSVRLPSAHLPAGRSVLVFDRVNGGYEPRHPVVRNLSFSITGPERIAITGSNGSGKSTVLKLALGEVEPFFGEVRRPVRAAMLEQQLSMLDRRATILENFRRINPTDNDNACHAALARFQFRADAARRCFGNLSGGEMLRAGLACVLGGSEPPQLLMLDEPTNHLDLDSIASLEAGLNDYDGALLVVSHDTDFLSAIRVGRKIDLEA